MNDVVMLVLAVCALISVIVSGGPER